MAKLNLIDVHADRWPILRDSPTIINANNWRVIGKMKNEKFFLVAEDLSIYHINDLTIERFCKNVKLNIDMNVVGEYICLVLACQVCESSGITDWVKEITKPTDDPKRNRRIFYGDDTFKFLRDIDGGYFKLETENISDYVSFTGYYSRAIVPEAHKHCESCHGTGIYLPDLTSTKPTEVVKSIFK